MISAFDQVKNNRYRTYLLFFLFVLIITPLFLLVGYFLDSFFLGLIFATMFFAIYIPYVLNSGYKTILIGLGAKEVKKADYPHLFHTVEGLSISAGLKTIPKCYVIQDKAMNAFATGKNKDDSIICVTTGLLDVLNREEVEGVVAHEMSHILNEDMKVMTIATMTVGVVALISEFILRFSIFGNSSNRSNDNNNGNAQIIILVVGLIFAILAPICAELTKLAISRKREYMADSSAVILTRNPNGLSSALKKISGNCAVKTATGSTSHLFISDPAKANFMQRMFSTHPPIEKRIELLNKM
ncbi:MAG: M48 family metallopeptidase [Candidatus Nanoarchaeia archaeon]|nr:M48 family metallopeptidase [Candidatus Nanoarchaeia archaeon]